nr:hypothetical protein [Bradyrhizobium elkanii]
MFDIVRRPVLKGLQLFVDARDRRIPPDRAQGHDAAREIITRLRVFGLLLLEESVARHDVDRLFQERPVPKLYFLVIVAVAGIGGGEGLAEIGLRRVGQNVLDLERSEFAKAAGPLMPLKAISTCCASLASK